MNVLVEITWVNVNAIIGTILNIFLVFIIITDTQLPGSGYKRLLILIAGYHMTFSFVHWFVEMNCTYDGNGFLCYSERMRHWGYWECYWGTVLYAFMCSQSLSLFAVHCCYRYVNITGSYRFIFARWHGCALVGTISFLFGFSYAMLLGVLMMPCPERTNLSRNFLATELGIDIDTVGYVGSLFQFPDQNGVMRLYTKHILVSFVCAIWMIFVHSTTCIVGVRLYFAVRDGMYTTSSRSLHMQLLCILLAQGTAPLITDLTPLAIVLTGGVFGLFPPHTSMYMPICVSSYPGIDAMMIILLFKAYRERCIYNVKRCFCFWKKIEDPFHETALKSISVTRIIGKGPVVQQQ